MKNDLFFYFFLTILIVSCDNRTSSEVYTEEVILPMFEGIVKSTELWKGGKLIIDIYGQKGTFGITNNHSVLLQIKGGDFFKKLPNSNKCYIRRGDSVFYFDCINLERLNKRTRVGIGAVKQWDRNKINRWLVNR